jgi:hypothetical protein
MSTFSLVPLHRVAVHVPESRRRAEGRRRPGPEPPRVSREGERRVCASQRAGCDMGRVHCANGPRRHCARGPRVNVQLGRVRIRPSDSGIIFLFSKYIQILKNSKICVGVI